MFMATGMWFVLVRLCRIMSKPCQYYQGKPNIKGRFGVTHQLKTESNVFGLAYRCLKFIDFQIAVLLPELFAHGISGVDMVVV